MVLHSPLFVQYKLARGLEHISKARGEKLSQKITDYGKNNFHIRKDLCSAVDCDRMMKIRRVFF